MRRWTKSQGTLVAAVVVIAVACTGSSPEETAVDSPQAPATEPASGVANVEDESASSTPDTTPEPTTPDTEPEPTTPDTTPDTEPEPTTPDAGDSGAAELLTAVAEASVGRSVRGETRIGIAPLDSGFVLASTTFETDADGKQQCDRLLR